MSKPSPLMWIIQMPSRSTRRRSIKSFNGGEHDVLGARYQQGEFETANRLTLPAGSAGWPSRIASLRFGAIANRV